MSMPLKPLAEINQEAIRLLYRELGVANAVHFLNQFSVGSGDYTAERGELFSGMSVDDIVSAIKQRRTARE